MTTISTDETIRLIEFSTAIVHHSIQMVMLLIGSQRFSEEIQTWIVSESAANRLSEAANSAAIEN